MIIISDIAPPPIGTPVINNVANNKKEEADDFSLHIREDNNNEEKTEDMKEKHEN